MKSEYFVLLPDNICCSLQSFSAIALKTSDENFVTAKCACINDGATLKPSDKVDNLEIKYYCMFSSSFKDIENKDGN